jgi:hypothetical protein
MRLFRTEFNGKEVQLACAHWRSFPPKAAIHQQPSHELRAKGIIDEAEYQRYQIWEKICGLFIMSPEKCLKCPHVRLAQFHNYLPVLMTLDGKSSTPTLDLPSLESSSRHRKFLESILPSSGKSK